jgi:hypothetical protein
MTWPQLILTILSAVIPLAVAVFVWGSTEVSRLRMDAYQRKEAHYVELVKALNGFYVATQKRETKAHFLQQMNICGLHCPDDVVRAGNAFLDTVQTGAGKTSSQRDQAASGFFLAMRRDLRPGTNLGDTDLRFFKLSEGDEHDGSPPRPPDSRRRR